MSYVRCTIYNSYIEIGKIVLFFSYGIILLLHTQHTLEFLYITNMFLSFLKIKFRN